jgi:hypothetical protein
MNNIYETGDYPSRWKTSMLRVIYNGEEDKLYIANYKGISILSTLSEMYTGVQAKRFNDWTEKRRGILEYRMGRTKAKRAPDNAFTTRTKRERLFTKRVELYWMFVELQKAFATVVGQALWWKLARKEVSTKCAEGVKCVCRNMKITVKFGSNGVPE